MKLLFFNISKHQTSKSRDLSLVRLFGILMILFSTSWSSYATHIVGGELYYNCLGNNEYEVTLTVYRDCENGVADFDDPAYLGVFSGDDPDALIFRVDMEFNPAINDTFFIEEVNPCLEIEEDVCIHRTIYKDTINLPYLEGGYVLAYQRCCRNGAIVNINEPLLTGATYTAEVTEEALLECDNSPVFNNWPPIFVCLNRPIDFDHSATDIDGDSLVYRLCTPYAGATDPLPRPKPLDFTPIGEEVFFIGDYGVDDMLGNPDNPLTIDSETGFLTGIPTIKGQFVVGVCVDEYRDGKLISTTRRDFQYIVGECTEITSIIGNPEIQCDDLNVSFINDSFDATEFIWNFGDPTTTTDTSSMENPTWTYPDTGQYTVTLISHLGDPCGDTLYWNLFLKTSTLEPDFNTQLLKCQDGVLIVVDNVSTDPFNVITDYSWEVDGVEVSISANPTFEVLGTDDVTITLYATATDGCTRSVTKVVSPGDVPTGIQRDTIYACEGDVVELFPDAVNLSTIIYEWTPDTELDNSTIANPTTTATQNQLYALTMTTEGSTCSAQFEKLLIVSDINNVDIEATITDSSDGSITTVTDTDVVTTCEGEFATLTTTNTTTEVVSYEWEDGFGNPITPNANGEITASPDGTLTYTVTITDNLGCTATNQITIQPSSVSIQVDELVDGTNTENGLEDITGDGILDMCPDDVGELHITDLNNNSSLTYTWSGATALITDGNGTSNPTITANQPSGIYTLTITASNAQGCEQSIDVPIEIHGIPAIDIDVEFTDLTTGETVNFTGVDEITICGDEQALLTLTSITTLSTETTYTWYNLEGENVGENGDLLAVTPNGTETYCAVVTDEAGCSATTCITLTGSPIDIVIEETDDDPTNGSGLEDIDGNGTLDICLDNSATLTVTNLDFEDINSYEWTGDVQIIASGDINSQTPTINHNQAGVYTLYLETTNQYDCDQMDTVLVEIHDLSVIDIEATLIDAETNGEVTISGQDTIKSCDDGLITLTTTQENSTTNDYTIVWLDENGDEVGQDESVVVNPDGSVTYTAVLTDGFGCQATTTITIEGSPIDITIVEVEQDTDGDGFPDVDVNGDGLIDLCLGDDFEFNVINNDVTQTVSYLWTASNPSISISDEATANPTINPSQAGEFALYLETINQYDCNQIDTIPVSILEAAEPIEFTYLQECIGFTINFSTDNPNYEYYSWNFGDDASTEIVGEQNPSFTYPEAGTYTVTLIPLAGIDCGLNVFTQDIEVNESVVDIDFSYSYDSCTPEQVVVQFTDESSSTQGNIKSWDWEFSNGETSDIQNPVLTFTEEVDLTVTLTIVNDTDCDGTITKTLDINIPTGIDFPQDTILCSYDDAIELNPNANPDYIYIWSEGLVGANPAVSPTETTTYFVTITDNTGAALCEFEDEITILVSPEIGLTIDATGSVSGPFVIDDSVTSNTITTCEEEEITITATTVTGTENDYTWTWDPSINGESEITVGLNGSVTHSLTVTDALGCEESLSLTVQGGPVDIEIEETIVTNDGGTDTLGVFNPDGTIDLCLGTEFIIQVNNLDPNDTLTYVWTGDAIINPADANSANPELIPTEAGIYTLYLEVTNQFGCNHLDTIPVTVIDPNESVSFTAVKECDGVTVNFTNNGSEEFDYIWTFSFPNAPDVVVNSHDATYVYSEVGIYDVMLEIDANVACVEPATAQISIFDPILTAGFSYEYVDCDSDGVTIIFTDESLNPDNNTTLVEWIINEETYTGETVELTYAENTTLNVVQTIYTANDCDTSTEPVELVIDIIDEIVLVDGGIHCQNDPAVELNPNGNTTYEYQWSPSAGLSCDDCPNPMADPDITTTYIVTVTNNNGAVPCIVMDSVTLEVPEVIVLNLSADVVECADEATLTVAGNLPNLTYEWFEEGVDAPFSTETTVNLEPSGAVTYIVVATDTDSGCTESASVMVTGTGVDVEVDDLQFFCINEEGVISIVNTDETDTLTYQWEGVNILSPTDEASITIATDVAVAEDYSVTITNQYGCSIVENITAVVLQEPTIPNRGQCEGLTVTFHFEDDFNTPYYIWDFGDDSPTETDLGDTVMHTYPANGTYTVTLTLPNGDDCFEPISFPIEVNDQGLNAAYEPTFEGDCSEVTTITFNDLSVSENQGTINSWEWNFGIHGVSSEQNPTIQLADTDTIMGTLIIGTDALCFDTIPLNQPVFVINDEISIPDIAACIDTDTVLNINAQSGYTYDWADFGIENSPEITVNGNDTYTVTITNDAQNCTSVQDVMVSNYQTMNICINNCDDHIWECTEMDVVLAATSDVVGVDYEWSTKDGIIDTGSSITVSTGDGLVDVTYFVEGTDSNGCVEMDTVLVSNEQVMVEIMPSSNHSCDPEEDFVQVDVAISLASQSQSLDFVWEGANIDNPDSDTPVLSPIETTEYTVTVTANEFGCTMDTSFVIEVSDINSIVTEVTASEDTIFIDNSVDLAAVLGDYNYFWTEENGIDPMDLNDPMVTAIPEEVGEHIYTISVTDSLDCEARASVLVVVLARDCDEPFIFFPNAFSPNGDGENDQLMLLHNENHVVEASWAIYNRWGQKVFETNDQNGIWDGTYKGEPLAPDVYGFRLRALCVDGQEFYRQGNVTIIK